MYPLSTDVSSTTYIAGLKGQSCIKSTSQAGTHSSLISARLTNGYMSYYKYETHTGILFRYYGNDENGYDQRVILMNQDGETILNFLRMKSPVNGAGYETIKINTNGAADVFSNYTGGPVYVGNINNGQTWIRGNSVMLEPQSPKGLLGYRLRLFREEGNYDGSTGRTVLRCDYNGVAFLGTASYRYNTAFFTNSITASDRKIKTNIKDITSEDALTASTFINFMMGLKPKLYNLNKDNSDSGSKRFHSGFIAQEVNELINKLGLPSLSLCQASVINEDGTESKYSPDVPDEKLVWGLNYSEFVPMSIMFSQVIYNMVTSLLDRVDKLEGKEVI